MKYRNVIFDLGNVLVALDNEACARALTAIGCERLVRVNDDPAVRRLFDQLGLGLISNVQFYAQVRRLTAPLPPMRKSIRPATRCSLLSPTSRSNACSICAVLAAALFC